MERPPNPTPTAAIALIGNELLSGKVADENGPFLIRELRTLGVAVKELRIVADEVPAIAEAIRALGDRHTHLFTTGGVGPTHDDITLEGVAQAFGVDLVENEAMVHHIDRIFGAEPEKRATFLKMAQVPEGSTLIHTADLFWPIYTIKNVYILPGVPEIFRRQFAAIRERFHTEPFFLRTVYFRIGEGELARSLTDACYRFPSAAFGSYPVWRNDDYRVRITIESKDRPTVETASRWLVEQFTPEDIFKVVDGQA